MVSSTNRNPIPRPSKPAQHMRLQSSSRTLLDYTKKEDELATEMAELQSEIDKIDAQEETLKEDEAEIEEAIEEEEEYLDELVDDLPDESGDGENDNNEHGKNAKQDEAFMPSQHQMYLAYQTARAEIECDDARAEVKKDQQEEADEAESGNKPEEEAIEKDMAEAEEEIAKECVEKKDLMQRLIEEAEAECDLDKDKQECEVVKKLLDLVENAKEDIQSGEVGIWPKADVIEERDESDNDASGSLTDNEAASAEKEKKLHDIVKENDTTGNVHSDKNDVDIDLASLEFKLTDAEEECTKVRSELPDGFELRAENAEEIQAVNEGCCLGQHAADGNCKAAIPKAECDVYRTCAEAKTIADQLRSELDNNLDIAEAKCREGAKGILVENPGKIEGPYDNLDDLDIIRMTCCLAPYDADMVYCQDKAQVAQVRTNNRCNLLEYCLEANHLESSLTEKQTATEGDVAGQVDQGNNDEYASLSHVGGRGDDNGKKEAFDKSKGLEAIQSTETFGGDQNELDGSNHNWSATVWLALVLGVLLASVLVIRLKRRKSRQSGSLFEQRRFDRGSMPSHHSRRKSWNEDAEYGLGEHSAQLSLDHDGDTTSFAPAFATSALYGGQRFT